LSPISIVAVAGLNDHGCDVTFKEKTGEVTFRKGSETWIIGKRDRNKYKLHREPIGPVVPTETPPALNACNAKVTKETSFKIIFLHGRMKKS
jgi:hypothetical protein